MTAADRLRAEVEAALPDGVHVISPEHGALADADTRLREIVIAAVLPIVEERDAEIARLRVVLRFALEEYRDVKSYAPEWAVLKWKFDADATLEAALRGDLAAVKAAGVALPEEK